MNIRTLLIFLALINIDPALASNVRTLYHGQYMNGADPLLGYSPIPHSKVKAEKLYKDQVVYSVDYEFDQYGRRTSNTVSTEKKQKFAIFLGGSNTFGEGVSFDESLPHLFEKVAPRFKSYNYAFQGYGLNHALVQLKNINFSEQVPEPKGYAFYQYFYFHRHRLLGTAKYFSWSRGRAPSFVLQDGHLVHKGLFAVERPIYYSFMRFLYWTQIPKFLGLDYPDVYSDYSNQLLCASLLEARNLFKQKFPESEFVVLVGMRNKKEEPVVETCLDPQSISYIDMREVYPKDKKNYRIQFGIEDHNNGKANQLIAETIFKWILGKQRPTY